MNRGPGSTKGVDFPEPFFAAFSLRSQPRYGPVAKSDDSGAPRRNALGAISVNVQQQVLDGRSALGGLTDKQRQVLDLLIEHQTSKEIARRLRISPHTVDQRIQFAKEKLGARTRNEAAVAYRRLLEICEQVTYEDSGIAAGGPAMDEGAGPQGPLPVSSLRQRFRSRPEDAPEADFQVVPELFDGRHGTLVRVGAIFAIALFLVLIVLGGLAMFSQLSQLMTGM